MIFRCSHLDNKDTFSKSVHIQYPATYLSAYLFIFVPLTFVKFLIFVFIVGSFSKNIKNG